MTEENIDLEAFIVQVTRLELNLIKALEVRVQLMPQDPKRIRAEIDRMRTQFIKNREAFDMFRMAGMEKEWFGVLAKYERALDGVHINTRK